MHLLCDWVDVGSNLAKNEINFFIFANIFMARIWKGRETLVTMGLQRRLGKTTHNDLEWIKGAELWEHWGEPFWVKKNYQPSIFKQRKPSKGSYFVLMIMCKRNQVRRAISCLWLRSLLSWFYVCMSWIFVLYVLGFEVCCFWYCLKSILYSGMNIMRVFVRYDCLWFNLKFWWLNWV